ncbi:MAG: hypothetical protein ACT4QC_20195 [Planctomycetaceae bacterium]
MGDQRASRGPIGLVLRHPAISLAVVGLVILVAPRLAVQALIRSIEREHSWLPGTLLPHNFIIVGFGAASLKAGTLLTVSAAIGGACLLTALVLAIRGRSRAGRGGEE